MAYRGDITRNATAELEELYLWVVKRAPGQGAAWFNAVEDSAAVLGVSDVPGAAGVVLVRVRVPGGIAAGPAVGVRLTYLERPSNHVTMAVR